MRGRALLALRLPTIFGSPTLMLEGGLISYGPDDMRENVRRGATYIDSILRGTRPCDLPLYRQAGLCWYSTSRPPRLWILPSIPLSRRGD